MGSCRNRLVRSMPGPAPALRAHSPRFLVSSLSRLKFLSPSPPNVSKRRGESPSRRRDAPINRFFRTTDERDSALRATFAEFVARPALIAGQLARFLSSSLHAFLFSC